MVRVNDIIKVAERLAPKKLAYDWDNIGLQIGSKSANVKKILLSLDINEQVIDEAIEQECQLIIAHHPMIFKPIKKINKDNYQGNIIYKAINNNLNIYTMHTNLDISKNGLNDYLADILEIKNTNYLKLTSEREEELYKLVSYIPSESFEIVREGILEAGAGHIGNYSHTSFSSKGQGTFKPLMGSEPYIGDVGELNNVDEYRFETVVKKQDIKAALKAMHELHPYEEIAYDLYPLSNSSENGLGRIGFLQKEIKFIEYIKFVKSRLNIQQLKYVGDTNAKIKCIAICSGSGADFIAKSAEKGADLLITSDIKYHDGQLAEELGINLIDAGHYHTEIIVKFLLYEYFKREIKGVKIIKSNINTNPWNYLS